MTFYEDIVHYYDSIFPVSENTISYLVSLFSSKRKNVLDIACGTGGYAIRLSEAGFNVTGVDVDAGMLNSASLKSKTVPKPKFVNENMTKLLQRFNDMSFDAIYCIGNSLVHLDNLDQMKDFMFSVKLLLSRNGVFTFQIINYDRVVKNNIKGLPDIIDPNVPLKFERLYNYSKDKNKILFSTKLTIGQSCKLNQIWLTPLFFEDVMTMLNEAGFLDIKAYGDFDGTPFEKDKSFMLVVQAK